MFQKSHRKLDDIFQIFHRSNCDRSQFRLLHKKFLALRCLCKTLAASRCSVFVKLTTEKKTYREIRYFKPSILNCADPFMVISFRRDFVEFLFIVKRQKYSKSVHVNLHTFFILNPRVYGDDRKQNRNQLTNMYERMRITFE